LLPQYGCYKRVTYMRILFIEDDVKLGPTLRKLLRKQGYIVDLEKTGKEGQEKALLSRYDLIILDLNLPDLDGLEICRGVRADKVTTTLLVLTSRDSLMDKIVCLDSGADDYLTKPFHTQELFARIRALLRRPEKSLPAILRVEDITLDPSTHIVTKAGQTIGLMPKEYALLEYLMRNADRAVTKDELLRHVWGVYSRTSSNRLEVYVRYLRNKIDYPYNCDSIRTVSGVGYRFFSQSA
jgi:DNA-binding response OmpR family regulator